MRSLPSPFSSSAFVWAENLAPGRNQFVSFLREVQGAAGREAVLHLFADTRFRLWVNEAFVAYGPARFVTQFAEYDSYDLTPFLRNGKNLIRVEVNYYGASSFQSMPDGLPGFIAAGGVNGGAVFATPGEWQALIHHAWDAEAPLFSFAQNPAEICDTRLLTEELTSGKTAALTVLSSGDAPWSLLRPRSAPYPDYHLMQPATLLLAAPGRDDRQLFAVKLCDPDYSTRRILPRAFQHKRWCIAGWIHSPRAQNVTFESHWSETEVNGEMVVMDEETPFGNHAQFQVELRAGWNFYSANAPGLTEYWSHLLAWPQSAELSLHALPERTCSQPWAISPAFTDDAPAKGPADPAVYHLPEGWTLDSGDPSRATPARVTAWDQPLSGKIKGPLPASDIARIGLRARVGIWSFDFEDQYYGQPLLEVEAPAGTILDVAYDDWKREDGCVNLYNSNPFTDAVDRFILRGGRQTLEVLNPRGGIFLQCVLRAPADVVAPVLTLHRVAIRSRQILATGHPQGDFHSGDPDFDWVWEKSLHTLVASTDEAYADCPWRERGSYIGDSLVNFRVHCLASADLSIARRTFRMMGEGQHLDGPRQGQLASVTPAWHRQGHDDFTLIWILCLRDYWRRTGDTSLLAECRERIDAIWASPVWRENPHGLWDIHVDQHPFIDWGVLKEDRRGASNLILNAFRVGAALASAEIEAALGRPEASDQYREEARRVKTALEGRLWREEQGRFAASDDHESPCLHGQVLAMAFGVGDRVRLLRTIEAELRSNLRKGLSEGESAGHLELYFLGYLLPVLGEMGQLELAETLIADHYGYLRGLGYPTLNECFCRAARGKGSCCHSWSGSGAVYLADYTLGLRNLPGHPDRWIFQPHSHRFSEISGALPLKQGLLKVQWRRAQNGRIHARLEVPDGVEVIVDPEVMLDLETFSTSKGS